MQGFGFYIEAFVQTKKLKSSMLKFPKPEHCIANIQRLFQIHKYLIAFFIQNAYFCVLILLEDYSNGKEACLLNK